MYKSDYDAKSISVFDKKQRPNLNTFSLKFFVFITYILIVINYTLYNTSLLKIIIVCSRFYYSVAI